MVSVLTLSVDHIALMYLYRDAVLSFPDPRLKAFMGVAGMAALDVGVALSRRGSLSPGAMAHSADVGGADVQAGPLAGLGGLV